MSPSPTADVEERLRRTFASQARAVRPTDRHWDEYVPPRTSGGRSRVLAIAAALLLAVGTVTVLVATRRHPTPPATRPGTTSPVTPTPTPPAAPTPTPESPTPRVDWSIRHVTLTADSIVLEVGGARLVGRGDPAVIPFGDPGSATYETLEADWLEAGWQVDLYVGFGADDNNWWVSSLMVSTGALATGESAAWVGLPVDRLRAPLGTAFDGDLDLTTTAGGVTSRLRFTGLHLLPFVDPCRSSRCDDASALTEPTEPTGASTTPSGFGTPNVPAPPGPPTPDLGHFDDVDALVAALQASGPLDNETDVAHAEGRAPNVSICAEMVTAREPDAGTVVHQASTGYQDDGGVVLVLQPPDGGREVRLYSTGPPDPATGGCRLLAATRI